MEEKIYFPQEDIFEIISEILKKNGLEETLDDLSEKGETENSLIIIVLNLAEELVNQKISEKDFVASLEKQLQVSHQTAQDIVKKVKEEILPLAEKITIGGQETEKTTTTPNPLRPITEPENPQKITENQRPASPQIPKEPPIEKRIVKKPQVAKRTVSPIKNDAPPAPQKPDSYREPIE